jgi:outer membrane protein OmpA-like peptidoglycan-associated protein
MIAMAKLRYLLISGAALCALPLHAADVDETAMGNAVERHLSDDVTFTQWAQDPEYIAGEEGDSIVKREVVANDLETIKLSNLVPPIHFKSGVARIPDETVESLAEILERMRDRINVRLNLIGHADSQPLSGRLEKIYGDNEGLSRERAGQVAEHIQTALALPAEAISYEWAGATQPIASNTNEAGRTLNRRVEIEVWFDEVRERVVLEEFLVPHDIKRVKVCRMETVCKLRYIDGFAKRARVQNLIAPLRFGEETIEVSPSFIDQVRQGFENLREKQNVVVRFVGYTDETPLTGRNARIYGNHVGLSKARARRVALAVQESLSVASAFITSDGAGSAKPLGSNETESGRALNRRVEVEFWYDDPLQNLPDEPQLCPESAEAEMVTRIYDPPWGPIENIEFVDGKPVVSKGYTDKLERALADVAGKTNARLRFAGYTRNERMSRRNAAVYGDDIGFSASRARRAMERIAVDMQFEPAHHEYEGRGYVHSKDVVNAGFTLGETSHVAIEVVYDELAVLDDYEGVDVTRLTREITPQNPLGLNLMRITVDGVPIDDPQRSSSDIQRCTDVAMQTEDIQFGFDNLRAEPRLSGSVSPRRIVVSRVINQETLVAPVQFRMYTNYSHFIDRAEVRVFDNGQSLESDPLAVIDIELNGLATWQPPAFWFTGPVRELAYVIRAYSGDGKFDETHPQPLWVVYDSVEKPKETDSGGDFELDPALLAAYGENELSLHNIELNSGTVGVRGTGIPVGKEVYFAGRPVPIDGNGNFIAEEILPTGVHTVEVAVVDEQGSGKLYLRDLELETDDWFYVGMADLTLSSSDTSDAATLLAGENPKQDIDSNADGRIAFFVNGKFSDDWKLTASADTREGSLDEIFSNLMGKSPESLFRRLDPDYYYPTFGDDSTVAEMAPTMGKFFVRLSDDDNYGQWGNFLVGYMNNELAQVDRGLYGANLHYQSDSTTDFGEQRIAVDGFAAEPGTVPSREEFRGTGGSLYFLNRQDILTGSERVRIEIRDKASGIVTGVVNLTPIIDYDIDYLQGRVVLVDPLASTVDDNLLVRSNALSGDVPYLVVRYEYTPGVNEIDSMSLGGQAHVWLGDYVKVGITANDNDNDVGDSSLNAGDITLRIAPQSWLKVQQAQSEGQVAATTFSKDGGYEFVGYDPLAFVNTKANASRADLSLSSKELLNFGNGQLTLYRQDVDAGYSAPGLTTLTDIENYGGTFNMPIAERASVGAKVDQLTQEQGLETSIQEFNTGYRLGHHWDISLGYRMDERIDRSPVVALTQEQGERADAIVQVGYDSKSDWNTYGFVQDTVSVTGNRRENARAGLGGSYLMWERLRIDAEVSDGDLGRGGRVGTNYMHSDRTSMYMNYALQNERDYYGTRSGVGSEGNLVAGVKSRIADSTSVFLEERYQHSDAMTGLTHGTGISFAPSQNWTLGFNTDVGTLEDRFSGAETERVAVGAQLGFTSQAFHFSSGVEYRDDESEQPDLSWTERTTWLFRNNFEYQINPGSRLLGKLNHSFSESSLGTFYDGGYTEAVFGYALRPVHNDRLNVLTKYTYFYNVPTTDQITLQNIAAEFIQKSHIAAVDVTYDLTPSFSIGGKYAYRLGQVSLDRENEEFHDNNASLYVLRGDYRFRKNWELLLEGRVLDMPDLNERRTGALAAISRYLGDHVKVGIGYNFTDFSDDLTDLSFNHNGVFLNLTGTM